MLEHPGRGGWGRWIAVALALLAGACGAASPKGAPAAELLSAAETEAIVARWQGAWVMPWRTGDPYSSRIGTHEVWAVEGTRLTRWDGDAEEVETMTLLARCLVKVGEQRFSYHAFAFGADGLIVDGRIGVRAGDAITVCSDLGGVYTFDGTTCRYWHRPIVGRAGLVPHPATCKVDGARFEATSPDDVTGPHALRIDGELVRQDVEAAREPAIRFDTLAAAKASLLD